VDMQYMTYCICILLDGTVFFLLIQSGLIKFT